jgi:hypothetical protein
VRHYKKGDPRGYRNLDGNEVRDPSSHRTPSQIKQMDRQGGYNATHYKAIEERHRARAQVERKLGHKLPHDMDVDHKKMVIHGGTNAPSNLRVISASRNRGWADGKV